MQDITQLEQRISAAFERMDRGLERLLHARRAALEDGLGEGAPLSPPDLPPDTPPSVDDNPLDDAFVSDHAQEAAQSAPNWASVQPAAPGIEPLLRALEQAKASNADWAERYAALQAQTNDQTFAMASEIARLTAALADAQSGVPAHHEDLDDLTARLAAQEAELEILRAQRDQNTAELDEIIAALTPLVEDTPYV